MKMIDSIKGIFNVKDRGYKRKYRQVYKEQCESAQRDITRYEGYINEKQELLDKYNNKGINHDSKQYISCVQELLRWKKCLDDKKLDLIFFREPNLEDISYRNGAIKRLPNELKEICSTELDLRFHATTIGHAWQIIKSKGISSILERYGYSDSQTGKFISYNTGTDMYGEISVSDINSIETSVNFFMGSTSNNYVSPCGVLFVLKPKDKNDSNLIRRLSMKSVSFERNSEQLYAIVSTVENIDRLKVWATESNLDKSLVLTIVEFKEKVRIDSKNLNTSSKDFRLKQQSPSGGTGAAIRKNSGTNNRPEIEPGDS